MRRVFLFDLDSTITKEEILPTIAEEIGKGEEMRFLTESTMMGEMPFNESFASRVKILQEIPVDVVAERVKKIKINEQLMQFIRQNKENCYIVTSNLDVWIQRFVEENGMNGRVFCSEANIKDGKICGIKKILKKEDPIANFSDVDVVAVGDGSNDYNLLRGANIGIAFGGVRMVAPKLLEICNYSVYTEEKLCELLNAIKEGND